MDRSVPPPELPVRLAGGDRVVVQPASDDDRVTDLLHALVAAGRLPPPIDGPVNARAADGLVDGRVVSASSTLIAAGVRAGSLVGWATSQPSSGESGAAVLELHVVGGPDAGHCWPLPPGRFVLGRAAGADLVVDDPALEPHHLLLEVHPAGTVMVVQLCGHVPVRAGAVPLPRRPLPAGVTVHLGASSVALVAPSGDHSDDEPASAPAPGDPWHVVHHRRPRPEPAPAPVDPEAAGPAPSGRTPEPPATHGSLVGPGLVSLGVSVVLAAVLGRPELVWFGLLAAATSLGLAAHQWLQRARHRRRARREGEAALAEAHRRRAEAHRRAVADRWARCSELAELARWARCGDARIWWRRPQHTDAWSVVVGRGDLPFAWPAHAQPWPDVPDVPDVLPGVPVTVELGPATVLGVSGGADSAAALVRSLLLQLAVQVGPADWQLLVVAAEAASLDPWRPLAWLPHASTPVDTLVVEDELADHAPSLAADPRHLVVVATDASLLAHRTGPLRRLLATLERTVAVVVTGPMDRLPAWCTQRAELTSTGTVRIGRSDGTIVARAALATTATATEVAARLACRHDPELASTGASLPAVVPMSSLLGPLDVAHVATEWSRRAGALIAPIGMAADGVVELDLVRDGPHALIAGTTGAGKSELLRTLVVGLAMRAGPDRLAFVLVDYKGGAAFDACQRLPHVAGVVTDLDEHLGARVLLGLEAELKRREGLLRDAGAADLDDLHRGGGEPLARLVVVVDEFATLAVELPDFLGSLVAIAQRGRSLGVHLVLATQRPGGVVRDDVRANTNLRVALRVQDPADALDVVGHAAPAGFARARPGLAMVRLGPDERLTFQAATTSLPAGDLAARARLRLRPEPRSGLTDALVAADRTELDGLVDLAVAAADRRRLGRAVAPWLPPLPERLERTGAPDAFVLLDDPARQRQEPLRWTAAGHLMVVGARGTGISSTLVTAVSVLASTRPPDRLHLYGLDGRGGAGLVPMQRWQHTGDVVPLADFDRARRLLDRLDAELTSRQERRDPSPVIVLVVDGAAAVRAALDDDVELSVTWERLAREGPAVGLVMAVGAERDGVLGPAFAAAVECRIGLAHPDPLDPGAHPPWGAPPGRCRHGATGLVGQVLHPASAPPPHAMTAGAAGTIATPVGALPTTVTALRLRPCHQPGRATVLPVGIAHRQLDEVTLTVPRGDHVTVLGPPGSGRTTTLHHLVDQWSMARPDSLVLRVGHDSEVPTRAQLDPGRPLALVVDDAHLVEDAGGELAALFADRSLDLTCFVAARPDLLRGQFGHWTTTVRRSGLGVVLGPAGDLDGDLLACPLPRSWPLAPRPGLGWLVQAGRAQLVQVASPEASGEHITPAGG